MDVNIKNQSIEHFKLIWDEYKYRHELCWNLIFKITLVTTALSIMPYLDNKIIPQAKRLVFFTPVISICISIIGGLMLFRELKLLDRIRKLHWRNQNELYNNELHYINEKSSFTSRVIAYLILLTCLTVINFIVTLKYIYFQK